MEKKKIKTTNIKHIISKLDGLPIWVKGIIGLVLGPLLIILLPFIFLGIIGLHIFEAFVDFLEDFNKIHFTD